MTFFGDAINNNQDIWRELRNPGLLSSPKIDLHSFTPDDLNIYFAGTSFTAIETELFDNATALVDTASDEGFKFKKSFLMK